MTSSEKRAILSLALWAGLRPLRQMLRRDLEHHSAAAIFLTMI